MTHPDPATLSALLAIDWSVPCVITERWKQTVAEAKQEQAKSTVKMIDESKRRKHTQQTFGKAG